MSVQETKSPNKAVVVLIVITLLAAVAAGSIYISNSRSDATSLAATNSRPNSAPTNSSSSATSISTTYKNGVYTASGSYATPESSESIKLTVTIADNAITQASVQNSGNVRESRDYQQRFSRIFSGYVVGKNIDSVSLSRVAGSSLTSDGFNNALDQIKNDALV